MGLRKESDKQLQMKKKESSFQRESNKRMANDDNENSLSGIKNKAKPKTKSNFSKGVDSYRQKLEEDDYGIESTNKMIDSTKKVTDTGINKIKDHHKNKKSNQLRKAEEEHLKSVQQKLGYEIKNKQKNSSSKLKNEVSQDKNSFLKKVIRQPQNLSRTSIKKGVDSYNEALQSDDEGIEIGAKGINLVKDGTKSLSQANKVRRKKSVNKKIKGHQTKLTTDGKFKKATLNPNFKKEQKALQKKKIIRANIYKNQAKTPVSLTSLTKKTGLTAKNGFIAAKRAASLLVKKAMSTKVMAVIGALFIKLLPVLAVIAGVIAVMVVFTSFGGGGGKEEMESSQGNLGLDPAVEQWRDLVTEVADEKGMSDYIDLVLAIIQVESGGDKYKDIMQSSESAGHPRNYFQDERQSVEQGITHLKNVVQLLKSYNNDYLNDHKLIAQTYNFGLGFARYVGGKNLEGYDIDVSETYSKDVVAVSLGNLTGETYSYNNAVSERVGKTYLYRNGGNFLYGELIGEYIGGGYADGEIAPPVEPMLVTSHYGHRASPGGIGTTNHKGIDLNCTGGVTPIRSILEGTVVKSQYVNGLGNTVVVKHDSFYSTYGHMSSLSVSAGQTVKAGTQLGICGSTGLSTGPHLHLEISPQPHMNQVDPYPYIKHLIGG